MISKVLDLCLGEVSQSIEKTLVPVGHCKVSDGNSVLRELQQILVIFYGLLCDVVVHWCHGKSVDLLYNGVRLLDTFLIVFTFGFLAISVILVGVL